MDQALLTGNVQLLTDTYDKAHSELRIKDELHHRIGEILVYMIMSDNYGMGFDH